MERLPIGRPQRFTCKSVKVTRSVPAELVKALDQWLEVEKAKYILHSKGKTVRTKGLWARTTKTDEQLV